VCNGIFFIDGLGWVGLRKLDPCPCLHHEYRAKQLVKSTTVASSLTGRFGW